MRRAWVLVAVLTPLLAPSFPVIDGWMWSGWGGVPGGKFRGATVPAGVAHEIQAFWTF